MKMRLIITVTTYSELFYEGSQKSLKLVYFGFVCSVLYSLWIYVQFYLFIVCD